MAYHFDKGDVVILKAGGGPPMTVQEVSENKVKVTFLDPEKGEVVSREFAPEALRHYFSSEQLSVLLIAATSILGIV